MSFLIRPATGADSTKAADVVMAVFQEYGFSWDEDGYCADLYDLQTHYLSLGNFFWVAEVDGHVCGTTALELYAQMPGRLGETIVFDERIRAAGADCSLERLYVHPDARGLGIGRALMDTTLGKARGLGRIAMEIWSDKKLENAHRLYGYYQAIPIGDRICDDPDESPEWGFILRL